jgi:hypothetical protein
MAIEAVLTGKPVPDLPAEQFDFLGKEPGRRRLL